MSSYWLRFTLQSNATFGRGSGIPGLIDQDVTFDRYGCPYLHGRTLKGLMNEVCADVLFALEMPQDWKDAADKLFGQPGSLSASQGIMQVGHARLPAALRKVIEHEAASTAPGAWSEGDVISALTTVRYQTALTLDGSPDDKTLRSVRVILRGTPFEASLHFSRKLTSQEKGLLAACVKGFRRAGTARNRGRGRLNARMDSETQQNVSEGWYQDFFKQEVCRR